MRISRIALDYRIALGSLPVQRGGFTGRRLSNQADEGISWHYGSEEGHRGQSHHLDGFLVTHKVGSHLWR